MSKVQFQIPVASIHGAVSRLDEVYFRSYGDKIIMQRKPKMRSPKRIAACIAFGERYGKGKTRSNHGASTEHLLPKD